MTSAMEVRNSACGYLHVREAHSACPHARVPGGSAVVPSLPVRRCARRAAEHQPRSSLTKPMSAAFHCAGFRVSIATSCPASAASAAKIGVELPPPTTVTYIVRKVRHPRGAPEWRKGTEGRRAAGSRQQLPIGSAMHVNGLSTWHASATLGQTAGLMSCDSPPPPDAPRRKGGHISPTLRALAARARGWVAAPFIPPPASPSPTTTVR